MVEEENKLDKHTCSSMVEEENQLDKIYQAGEKAFEQLVEEREQLVEEERLRKEIISLNGIVG